MFYVGQEVICVDTSSTDISLNGPLVLYDKVYRIREVCITRLGKPGIKLVGYEYSCHPGQQGEITKQSFIDAPMRSDRFRPIQKKKTDISIFTEMLNTKQKELVE